MNVPFYTTDGDQKQIKPSSRGKKTKRNMNVSQRLEEDEVYFRNYFERLGMPPCKKSAVFLNIVQKAFDPPPLLFEHLSYFAGGVF